MFYEMDQVRGLGLCAVWWRGRDSNPRPLGYEPNELPLLHPASDGRGGTNTTYVRTGGSRSGLASHGVAPAVLSGALLGHDRVRDGTGWVQNALGHDHHPSAHKTDKSARPAPPLVYWESAVGGALWGNEEIWCGEVCGSTLGHEHGSAPVGCPPSTSRLATWSYARGLSSFERGDSSCRGIPA